jgi:hypothetical protein
MKLKITRYENIRKRKRRCVGLCRAKKTPPIIGMRKENVTVGIACVKYQ